MNNDPEKPERPAGQATEEAPRRVNISAIYPTEFKPAGLEYDDGSKESADAILEVNKLKRKHPLRGRKVAFWCALGSIFLILVALFAWNPLNDNFIHTPFDFGPLTALCAAFALALVFGVARLIYQVARAAAKKQKFSAAYHLFVPLLMLISLGVAGWFEYKQQYIQFYLTPSVRKVSGVDTAVVRCDRVVGNLFGATRYGYVNYDSRGIAHLHPKGCGEIWNWAKVQNHDKTTDLQMHALDTVTHEAMHVGGMDSELGATCGSFEWIEDILVDLGASRVEAKRVAQAQSKKHENYHGNTQQQKQYEGDCSEVPSVR
ncbi:MAG: hypothetical protein LBH36_01930 [Candidatus Nomurabacteria bacterium]|jgi:hypothetical protein|nr:hypothetical protein [Candidatus Nomurabacteria bacterium]